VQVRLALEELGLTFVKFGQILAGRADLFGPEWIAEFEKLHSHVPALPDALRPQLREDLATSPRRCSHGLTPRRWPQPPSRKSTGRVCTTAPKSSSKIRRPGIADTIEADLRLLLRLAALAEAELPTLNPTAPSNWCANLPVRSSVSWTWPANAAMPSALPPTWRPWASSPSPRYWAHTRERVNVQDFIDGVPAAIWKLSRPRRV
jgi:ubiquinone biosynthesis protein